MYVDIYIASIMTEQLKIALLRADYERAAVHSTNETKEITELEMNNGISGDLYEGDLELTPSVC